MNFLSKLSRSSTLFKSSAVACAKVGFPKNIQVSYMHSVTKSPLVSSSFKPIILNRPTTKIFNTLNRDGSTLKKRRPKMNKHKRKKRKKLLLMNTKVSRG